MNTKNRHLNLTVRLHVAPADCPPQFAEPVLDDLWPDWADEYVRNVSQISWDRVRWPGGKGFRHVGHGLLVLISVSVEEDGLRWMHLSFSHRNRTPTYENMALVKETFVGEHRKAIMVLPGKHEHVNVHPYCLHLWHCVDGDYLPNFTRGRPRGHI